VTAVMGSVTVSSTVIRREVRLAVAAVGVFGLLAWTGLRTWSAALLVAAAVGALVLLLRWARSGHNQALADAVAVPPVVAAGTARQRPWVEAARALLGLVGVLAGAQLLVMGASTIATRLGASQVVIGFTLVAFGTSVPELVTAVVAQRRGQSDLVVGNLFGSNLFNSLAGGAVIGFATPAGAAQRPEHVLLALMVLTSIVAWALLRRGLRLTRPEGAVLLAIYVATIPFVLAA
jgi:cation:H+ antiporter